MHLIKSTCDHGRPRQVCVRWKAGWWDPEKDELKTNVVETVGFVAYQGREFVVVKTGRRARAITINRSAILDVRDVSELD